MDRIVIFGSSGHAKVVLDIVEKEQKYQIAGLIDKFRSVGETVLGYPVLGGEEQLPEVVLQHSIKGGLIAIGDNCLRSEVAERIAKIYPPFVFLRAEHPGANIARDVTLGAGTVVMAGATINPCCSIGEFCILNTNSSLDHDSSMGAFSSLAPGAATGGAVRIGAYAAIGLGAMLLQGIEIGEHTVVGAGSTVLEDLDPCKVAYGTPARVVRERKPGEKIY